MRRWLAALVLLALAVPAAAAEFRTIAESGALMYDAPSVRAKKIFVAARDYPVEIVTDLENWVKVRDCSGDFAWVEKKALSENRMVIVTAPVADIRAAASEQAPLVFQAQKDVVLSVAEPAAGGWIKVRHAGGQTGYVKVSQVWGT